jgi:outer membrane protein TolC
MRKLYIVILIITFSAVQSSAENKASSRDIDASYQAEILENLEKIGLQRIDPAELFSQKHAGTIYDPIKLEASFTEAIEISLEDLFAKALENNLNLNIARLRSKEAKWRFWNKVSEMLPDFTMVANKRKLDGTFYLNSNFAAPIDETVSSAGFRFNYRVFDGGTTSFLAWSERFYKESTEALERSEYNRVIYDTVDFYLNLVKEQVALVTKLKALERSQANLALTEKFLESGKGTQYDLMQAEANLAMSQQSLIETEADYRISQITLAEHLNIPLETTMKIQSNKLNTFEYISSDLEIAEFLKNAFTHNPNIESLLRAKQGAYKQGLSKLGDFLPKLDLYWDLTGTGQEFTEMFAVHTLGFQASYSLGEGMGLTAASSAMESKHTVDRARLEYEKQVLEIQKNLRTSFIDFQRSKALVHASHKQYLASKEALRLAKLRYENGLEVFANLLVKEEELTKSELNLISAIANYNLSQVKIAYNMGTISAEEILKSRV